MKRFVAVGLCLFLAALSVHGDAPKSNKAAIVYLQKLQLKGGGFAPFVDDQPQSSLHGDRRAVKALKYFGGEIPHKAACAEFVKSCFDKEQAEALSTSFRRSNQRRIHRHRRYNREATEAAGRTVRNGRRPVSRRKRQDVGGHSHRGGGLRGDGQAAGPGRRMAKTDR